MSSQTSSTGRCDAEHAAKGVAALSTPDYQKKPSEDYSNKPMTDNLDLGSPESIITIVCKDHQKVREFYTRYKECPLSEKHLHRDLAAAIIREVSMHSFLEENILYPQYVVNLDEEGKAAEKHSIEEHQKIKDLAYELDQGLDVQNAAFNTKLDELMRVFNHHSHEEECDFLVKMQHKVRPERLVEIGKDFESKRKIAPTRPHPSASAATLVGTMTKPVDATRDLASGRGAMAARAAQE